MSSQTVLINSSLNSALASFGTVPTNTIDASSLGNPNLGIYVTDQTLGFSPNYLGRDLVTGSMLAPEYAMWAGDQITRQDEYYGDPSPWNKRRRVTRPDAEEQDRWAKMIQSVQNAQTLPNKWRVAHQSDSIVLATDVPGVRSADLDVTIEDYKIVVNSTRFDTKKTDSITYPLSDAYDPTTVEAMLDCGVMTLVIKKYPDRKPKKVHVKFK